MCLRFHHQKICLLLPLVASYFLLAVWQDDMAFTEAYILRAHHTPGKKEKTRTPQFLQKGHAHVSTFHDGVSHFPPTWFRTCRGRLGRFCPGASSPSWPFGSRGRRAGSRRGRARSRGWPPRRRRPPRQPSKWSTVARNRCEKTTRAVRESNREEVNNSMLYHNKKKTGSFSATAHGSRREKNAANKQ